MPLSHTALLLGSLAGAVLFSMIIGTVASALVRWDGGTVPAALTRGGVAFGGSAAASSQSFSTLSNSGLAMSMCKAHRC